MSASAAKPSPAQFKFRRASHSLVASIARSGDSNGTRRQPYDKVSASNSASSDSQPLSVPSAVHLLEQRLGLTPRQAEVLHWVAEGKTNDEISTILKCSFHTVKTHLKEIFQRLCVHSRTAAAACAYRAHIGEAVPKQGAAQSKPQRKPPLA